MNWRKSSASNSTGNCVEIAVAIDGIKVRDSQGDTSPVLLFTVEEWVSFLQSVKEGRFDLEPSYDLSPVETWVSPQT
jgi:hypothetical protein